MGQLAAPSSLWRRSPGPWPRSRRRRWLRRDDLAGVATMFAAIPSLPRAELSRLTTQMIDRMDEIDGDPNLEHLADDDEDTHDSEQEENHA